MKIELRLLKDIIPYAKNLRKIPQKAIDKVALSIANVGPRQPIVTDEDGIIIVGTVRFLAAKKNGLESFPVDVAEGLKISHHGQPQPPGNRLGSGHRQNRS